MSAMMFVHYFFIQTIDILLVICYNIDVSERWMSQMNGGIHHETVSGFLHYQEVRR